jgi:hypothetical protein
MVDDLDCRNAFLVEQNAGGIETCCGFAAFEFAPLPWRSPRAALRGSKMATRSRTSVVKSLSFIDGIGAEIY